MSKREQKIFQPVEFQEVETVELDTDASSDEPGKAQLDCQRSAKDEEDEDDKNSSFSVIISPLPT